VGLGLKVFRKRHTIRAVLPGKGVEMRMRSTGKPSPGPRRTDSAELPAFTLTMPAVHTCAKCQTPNVWGKHECTYCGAPLVDKIDCPDCGRKCLAASSSCAYCGARLKAETRRETGDE
jgi:hypothetical protein